MTETAKHGTSKASATSAATETAAPEPATPDQSAQPDQAAATGEATESAAKPDLEETKRKFREALERKNHAHNDGQGQGGRDNAKINGAHGPAASRRNFRRKSG